VDRYLNNKKSITGYVFNAHSCAILWVTKITTMSLSCIEADYRTIVHAASESIWLRRIVGKLNLEQKQETP